MSNDQQDTSKNNISTAIDNLSLLRGFDADSFCNCGKAILFWVKTKMPWKEVSSTNKRHFVPQSRDFNFANFLQVCFSRLVFLVQLPSVSLPSFKLQDFYDSLLVFYEEIKRFLSIVPCPWIDYITHSTSLSWNRTCTEGIRVILGNTQCNCHFAITFVELLFSEKNAFFWLCCHL